MFKYLIFFLIVGVVIFNVLVISWIFLFGVLLKLFNSFWIVDDFILCNI